MSKAFDSLLGAVQGPDAKPPQPQAAGWRFTTMTYNVLSDALLHRYAEENYAGVPAADMEWRSRLGSMLAEIRRCAPDVLALQEVEQLSDFLDPLSELGYDGCFVASTGHRSDGSAILWNTCRFALLAKQELQYRRHGLRHNEALLVQLQPLQGEAAPPAAPADAQAADSAALPAGAVPADGTSAVPAAHQGGRNSAAGALPPLTVATVHMAHDAALDELIKPAQARVLLAAAQRLAAGGPAVILGDFNSQPGSLVHALCSDWGAAGGSKGSSGGEAGTAAGTDAKAAADEPAAGSGAAAANGIGGMLPADAAPADAAALAGAPEQMRLVSAYQAVCGMEAAFTAIGINAGLPHCTVDYIWYTPQAGGCRLQPRRVLQSPDASVLQHGAPSAVLPSDHILLVAEFELQPVA